MHVLIGRIVYGYHIYEVYLHDKSGYPAKYNSCAYVVAEV